MSVPNANATMVQSIAQYLHHSSAIQIRKVVTKTLLADLPLVAYILAMPHDGGVNERITRTSFCLPANHGAELFWRRQHSHPLLHRCRGHHSYLQTTTTSYNPTRPPRLGEQEIVSGLFSVEILHVHYSFCYMSIIISHARARISLLNCEKKRGFSL